MRKLIEFDLDNGENRFFFLDNLPNYEFLLNKIKRIFGEDINLNSFTREDYQEILKRENHLNFKGEYYYAIGDHDNPHLVIIRCGLDTMEY